jgi:hypothetical protein
MALCTLPERPTKSELLSAYAILNHACHSTESFMEAFTTVRAARDARGAATDHEQDLMRAALVFAAAGLDSLIKQLIRDTLQQVIAQNEGARAQFVDYVAGKLKRTDGQQIRFLAETIASEAPTIHLQRQLITELTGSSLQSKDELLRAAAYFAIPANEISDDVNKLKTIFQARNQIAHEMDVLLGQGNRGRRQRTVALMRDYSATILNTTLAFYLAVESRLEASAT